MPVNLGDMAFAEYKRALQRAEDAVRAGQADKAAAAFRQCSELYSQYANSASDPAIRRKRLEKARFYQDQALSLEKGSNHRQTSASSESNDPEPTAGSVTVDDYEAEVMGLIQQTQVKWGDIGGLEETKAAIKTAYGMALAKKPAGVQMKSWRAFLLYGPPGTGKTLLAAATAGSLDARFFNVKVSSLLSKYFGESSKLISALYAAAHKVSPSVIFLDEFESLAAPRDGGDTGSERRIISTLLAELDGLATKDQNDLVLTIGATNLPWQLDPAILSRFQKRIYIPLPDPAARKSILELQLDRRGFQSSLSVDELSRRTGGFSGREIEQICQSAITHMTQSANPDLLKLVDQGQEGLREYQIKIRPLIEEDFRSALTQIKPVATPAMLQKYERWALASEGA